MFHSKSKLLSKQLNDTRSKEACSTAVSGLQNTLSIAKDGKGLAGVPGLQICISSLLVVIDVIKARHIYLCWFVLSMFDDPENDRKRRGCRETCRPNRGIQHLPQQREDRKYISSSGRSSNRSSGQVGSISGTFDRPDSCSSSTLRKASEEFKASNGLMKRLVHRDDDVQSISGYIQTVAWSIQSFIVRYSRCADYGWMGLNTGFQVETTLAIEFALDVSKLLVLPMHSIFTTHKEIFTAFKEHSRKVQENFEHLHDTKTSGLQVCTCSCRLSN
jgi:hypothetical protein